MFIPFKENEPRPQQLPLFSDSKIIPSLHLDTYAVCTLAVYCCWLLLWLQKNLKIHKGQQFLHMSPWLFLIMINDLPVADTTLWKYIDDTTLVESVSKNETSYTQLRVDELVRQSEADGFQLNESKCKELRISFSRSGSSVDHITINDKQIEVVSSAKLLGVVVSDNLRWNAHVESICKKAATRLYFLKQLKRVRFHPRICYLCIQHVYALY